MSRIKLCRIMWMNGPRTWPLWGGWCIFVNACDMGHDAQRVFCPKTVADYNLWWNRRWKHNKLDDDVNFVLFAYFRNRFLSVLFWVNKSLSLRRFCHKVLFQEKKFDEATCKQVEITLIHHYYHQSAYADQCLQSAIEIRPKCWTFTDNPQYYLQDWRSLEIPKSH